ncbi:type II toxin-antitoxin system Y4mF family antitoxin [Cellulomonas sp. APG4]|uniref:type II toxin-antitoxin system Y4mF family antitoxin n=1 Tax=Cellulomonas sp. APG4 TaxID=1538656 RepID=UPI00351B5DE6
MTATRSAADTAAAIRAARRARGLTQAQLAERAGVGRQWLVALEKGHDRAELGKVIAVLSALGLTLATRETPTPPAHRTWLTAGDAADAIREELERGDTDFALRLLGRALSEFGNLTDPGDRAAFLAEPASTGDHRWDTLVAASIARACRKAGLRPPEWTRTRPLDSWWFPVYDPVLTARTMQRTPVDLAAHGIWLDERALEVV